MGRKPKKAKIVPNTKKEKLDYLKNFIRETNRKAKDIVVKFAIDEPNKERLPFGIPELDKFTGGGTICGNFFLIYGVSQVGKSSSVQHLIAESQKNGKVCAYIDLEHTFETPRAEQLGINVKELLLSENCDTAEQAMDLTITLSKSKSVDLIVIDSVQAMSPKEEQSTKKNVDLSIEHNEVAALAKKLGKFLRCCAPFIYKSKTSVVLIGQARTMGIGTFRTFLGRSGGNALGCWVAMNLFFRKGKGEDAPTEKYINDEGKEKDKKIGFSSVIKMEKKQVTAGAMELEELRLPFYFNSGFIKETKDEIKR